MKKVGFFVLVGCSLAVGIVGAVKLNFSYNGGYQVLNVNVEALVNGESSGGGCYGVGSFVCDHGSYYGKYY